jgi:dUTP pyrophosphatase
MKILFKLGDGAIMPEQANEEDAGYDVFNNTKCTPTTMTPGMRWKFDTNLFWEPWYDNEEENKIYDLLHMRIYIDIRDRSGMSLKKGMLKMAGVIDPIYRGNTLKMAGVIDPTYRGNIGIVLLNVSGETVVINPGDKIAQIVFSTCIHPTAFVKADELSDTARGTSGYGSTGYTVKI